VASGRSDETRASTWPQDATNPGPAPRAKLGQSPPAVQTCRLQRRVAEGSYRKPHWSGVRHTKTTARNPRDPRLVGTAGGPSPTLGGGHGVAISGVSSLDFDGRGRARIYPAESWLLPQTLGAFFQPGWRSSVFTSNPVGTSKIFTRGFAWTSICEGRDTLVVQPSLQKKNHRIGGRELPVARSPRGTLPSPNPPTRPSN